MKFLKALEMWIYRRMLKYPWTDKLSNVNALKEVMTQRQPIKSVRNRYVFSTCYAQ